MGPRHRRQAGRCHEARRGARRTDPPGRAGRQQADRGTGLRRAWQRVRRPGPGGGQALRAGRAPGKGPSLVPPGDREVPRPAPCGREGALRTGQAEGIEPPVRTGRPGVPRRQGLYRPRRPAGRSPRGCGSSATEGPPGRHRANGHNGPRRQPARQPAGQPTSQPTGQPTSQPTGRFCGSAGRCGQA
ncbi:MAG: PT domain-containing protein, partial [Planctomycetes bacterium]|nr:PT domain-containing protein [Planctomycetota bacterium]